MVVESHDDFPGVEISIAGGVGEMVRGNYCERFFFFLNSYVHCFYGTRNDMHLERYGQNKTANQTNNQQKK